MSVEDNGKLCLKKMCGGADVLCTVRNFMDLAVGSDMPAPDLKIQSTILNTHKEKEISSDTIYSSLSLQDADSQTRLIELLPGREGDKIRINLFNIDSLSSHPYEALSYVWGPRDADVTVSVNDRDLNVSANLFEALFHLRRIERKRLLWADAVCINQANDIEKSCQVSFMGEIYRNANDVVIFLGKEKDDSAMVMEYLNLDDVEQVGRQSPSRDDVIENPDEIIEAKDHSIVQERIQRCGFDSTRFLCAVNAFFKRPWWSRIWVVQEYQLARREPRWYCGRDWTSTATMRDRLAELFNYFVKEATPVTGNPAISMHTQLDIEHELMKMYERKFNVNPNVLDRESLRKGQRPFQLLFRLLRRECTDPRDRIFASREMLDPISKQIFVPNYAVPVNKIFAKLASYLLIHDECGYIYDLYELARSQDDMPSWTPDFARPISAYGATHLVPYRKASWVKDPEQLSICNSVLSVPGVEIDTLDLAQGLDDAPDIELLEAFWKLERLLERSSPAEDLPELARSSLPSYCLVPFTNVREHLVKAEALQLQDQFPSVQSNPGYIHIILYTLKQLIERQTISARYLSCEVWQHAETPFDDPSELVMAELRSVSTVGIAGKRFIGGACFDLPNLKTQIMSVTISNHEHHDLAGPQKQAVLNASHDSKTEIPLSSDDSCPQYSHIKDFLRQAKSQTELDSLKNAACMLAERYREIMIRVLTKQGPSIEQVRKELESAVADNFTASDSCVREMLEKCTCRGDKREEHQEILKDLKEKLEPRRQELSASAASIIDNGLNLESYDLFPKLYMTYKRQYTGYFITRLGFFGVTFQRQPDLKKWDKVVLLDGIPTPMILEDAGDGVTYRMKAAVDIVGLKQLDLKRLVELGIYRRRDYKIV